MQADERTRLHESIVRHVRDVITIVNADGVVRFVNDATARLLGHDADGSRGQGALDYVHPDDRALALERRSWLLGATGRTSVTVLRVRNGAGGWRHVETQGVNLLDDPDVQGLLYVTRDVEDRARAEVTLVHALAAQRVVAELGARALQSDDVDSVLEEGLRRVAALLGTPCVTLLLADGDGALQVRLQRDGRPLPRGHAWPGGPTSAATALETRTPTLVDDLRRDPRFPAPAELTDRGLVSGVDVVLEGGARPLGVLSAHAPRPRLFSAVDVQFLQGVANVLAGALQREERERTAVVRALHDPLTGLPTRPLFLDRLEHALSRVERGGGEVAVLVVDLDRFKQVNDVFGHAAGDAVLRAVGPRLLACARASDTVARFGGDEFVVLCEDDVNHVGVARVAARIRRACAEPFALPNGTAVLLSASVGTAWSIEVGGDAAALLDAADASMYLDKRSGLDD